MADSPSFGLFRSANTSEAISAGETIFSAGDTGDCLFAVREGEVDLVVAGQVVETVRPGGIFGEMSLLDGDPRAATAVARTNVDLVRVDEKQFEFMVRNTPNFALNVLRVVSRRLREMDRSVAANP